ncbi:recombinase family protein [Sutterella wadsworthensis]|uniref:recombinase family protein n=1 Tax=Sutterella wadsworthensis TaxID=40545 RepID=UPI0013F5C42F|nr:recombinase family protein [Sutterella wadsworthensis]
MGANLDGTSMTHIFGYFRVSSDQNPGRTEPDELLDEVQYGDTIVRCSLDRLDRSLANFLRLGEELTHRGVTLQFMKEGLRFEDEENVSSTSKLMLTLVSAFNEFERSIVKERQREGIELAKKREAFKGGVCRISDEKVSHMKHLLKERVLLAKVSRIISISRMSAYRYLECGKSKE